MDVLSGIYNNHILITSSYAWVIAQVLKVIFAFLNKRKFDFKRLVGAGGMPSSHSSFVVALSISIGKKLGFDSPEFAICFAFSLVVMYDAAGVRRAAGKQARVLNAIVEDMQSTGKVHQEKLKELIGHTPIEVIAGALVGTITAIII